MASSNEERQIWRKRMTSAVVPALFQASFPGRNRAKRVWRMLPSRSYRTVQRMLAGLGEPSATELIEMARQSNELRAELYRLLGDFHADTDAPRAGAMAATPVKTDGAVGGSAGPTVGGDA